MLQTANSLHRTRDTAVLLRSGLNLIQQALSIYSEDLLLIFCNQRFRAMFDLPPQLCEPGARFDDTIGFLARRGEYGAVADVDSFVAARVQQALTFEQHYVERKRANGRWLSIEGGPMRQGGWVSVYTDITDIKSQEEVLRSRSDKLSDSLLDRSEELARTNRALEATINRLHETQQHLEAAEARMRMAAETTPAHIARLDRQERYTYSNNRLPVYPANGAADIVGHSARDVLGPDVYDTIAPALNSAYDGQSKVVEFTLPGGSQRIRSAFTPDTTPSGAVTGAYVLSMDITASPSPEGPKTTLGSTACFGACTVRFDSLDILQDDAPQPTPLTVFEAALLRALLVNANRLITRQEIFAAPGLKPCSDRALDVRISRLRQKLGDNPKQPRHIRTVYGAGYIFVGEVTWPA